MNGELAGAAALVDYGNAFLRDVSRDDLGEWQQHSAFRHVTSIGFYYRTDLFRIFPRRTLIAVSPCDWFSWLGQRGVTALRLVMGRDGGWTIRSRNHRFDASWGSKLRYRPGAHEDGRDWTLAYVGTKRHPPASRSELDVTSAAINLRSALDDAATFARSMNLYDWQQRFMEARSALESRAPSIPYYADMLLAPEADVQRLAAASTKAWVFGGMGSWNDVELARRRWRAEHRMLTARLYAAVVDGIAASANARSRS